jgi:hypothetical protein
MPRHRHLGPAETGANLRSEIIAYAAASHPHRRGDFHAGTGANGKIESQRSWNRPVFTQSPLSFHPAAAAPNPSALSFEPAAAVVTQNDCRFGRTRRRQGAKSNFFGQTRRQEAEMAVVLPRCGRVWPPRALFLPAHGGGDPKRQSF